MKSEIKLKGISGIYLITNLVNGKFYVGRTKCMPTRCRQYEYDFKTRKIKHINNHLLRSMVKHGLHSFEFSPLEFCDLDVIQDRELYWIDNLKVTDRSAGYNLRRDVDGRMIVHAETSEKITRRLKKEWAAGKRSHHSQLLKESWRLRDRQYQSQVMTKALTKWFYKVDGQKMLYKELVESGLKHVVTAFHKKKTNSTIFKGCTIERFPWES